MANKIDLHIHTNKSDGSLTPSEVLELARSKGLEVVSITDHNTILGVKEIVESANNDIIIIPGIEFTISDYLDHTHLLAYFINFNSLVLHKALKIYEYRKYKTMLKFLEKLRKHDIDISEKKVMNAFGRLSYKNVARYLAAEGYVKTFDDAFIQYIDNRELLVNNAGFGLRETISLINEINGISVLAHPFSLGKTGSELEDIVVYLKSIGLDGLECYYGDYSKDQISFLVSLAEKHDLIITGGSDFHGEMKEKIQMGSGGGDLVIPYNILDNLIKYRNKRRI